LFSASATFNASTVATGMPVSAYEEAAGEIEAGESEGS
jgi:hypothetical protein